MRFYVIFTNNAKLYMITDYNTNMAMLTHDPEKLKDMGEIVVVFVYVHIVSIVMISLRR